MSPRSTNRTGTALERARAALEHEPIRLVLVLAAGTAVFATIAAAFGQRALEWSLGVACVAIAANLLWPVLARRRGTRHTPGGRHAARDD